jgi:succinoglycan biosynthesis transport protein ExoP
LIALCFAVVTTAAFLFSVQQTKKYTATASLLFSNNQLSQQVAGLAVASANNPQAQQNTNLKLVQLGDMAARTAAKLDHGLTPQKVKDAISASAQGESNIVTVAATATSPSLAARIANTYSEQFVSEQQNADHEYYASALALVNRQLAGLPPRQRSGAAGLALQDRAQSLGVLAELRSGTVQLAQSATLPSGPSSPKVTRNTILGMLLGLLLGVGVAFLLERLDQRIREPKDLERIYGLPLLGVVPESTALSNTPESGNGAWARLPRGDAEVFQLIRAHLRYFNVNRDLRTLVIASAAPGDGKTTVARNLAAAAASMGSRVLLVEADLRRPTIAAQMSIKSGPGLADVLIDGGALDDAVQSIEIEPAHRRNGDGRRFDVLVAGWVLPPNPAEIIESQAMERLMKSAKSEYDVVVIDTPPLTVVSDAFPLLRKADGVVIVGRVGRNRRDVAERLHETLAGVEAPLLGVVANGFEAGPLDTYTYGYGDDYLPDEPLPVRVSSGEDVGPSNGVQGFIGDGDSSDGAQRSTGAGDFSNGVQRASSAARTNGARSSDGIDRPRRARSSKPRKAPSAKPANDPSKPPKGPSSKPPTVRSS